MPKWTEDLRYRLYARLTPRELRAAFESSLASLNDEPGWMSLASQTSNLVVEPITPLQREQVVAASYYYWTYDPLLGRAVQLIRDYTFGQGWSWTASSSRVQQILDDFRSDGNKVILRSASQWELCERLQLAGELFFIFFVNRLSGRVRIRLAEPLEIKRVICNPNDKSEPWLYERKWQPLTLQANRTYAIGQERTDYYPDVNLLGREEGAQALALGTVSDEKTMVLMMHVKINSHGLRGVPLYLRALPFIAAYKGLIEDRATLSLAAATFAFKQKIVGNQSNLTRLEQTWRSIDFARRYGGAPGQERVPGGQIFLENEGSTLEGFSLDTKAGQAKVDAGLIRQMVAAASGLTEPDLTGDASTGNLATLASMSGPMYRMFQSWQTLFRGIFTDIAEVLVTARQVTGNLEGEVDSTVQIRTPPVLMMDLPAAITAMANLISAQADANYTFVGWERIATFILQAMGVDDIDRALKDVAARSPGSENRASPDQAQLQTQLAALTPLKRQQLAEAMAQVVTQLVGTV